VIGDCLFVFGETAPVGQGLLFHEVSRSHTMTNHSRQDSSERVISSSQRKVIGVNVIICLDMLYCDRSLYRISERLNSYCTSVTLTDFHKHRYLANVRIKNYGEDLNATDTLEQTL
jgi:hypothetical protein